MSRRRGLVSDCHRLYLAVPSHVRRRLNQAVFARIFAEDDEVTTGQLATPFGELLELEERTEAVEWGSEEQLKRHLRTGPVPRRSLGGVETTIARILDAHEKRAVLMDGPGRSENPGSFLKGQGSNVVLMAERGGFEPPTEVNPQ